MSTLHQSCVALVDDDVSLCRSMTRLLHASGIEVEAFHSAESFLEVADRSRFDCLLLDIELGGMSGIELHKRLVAAGATPPVIYITAHHAPEVRAEATQLGCEAYFRKTEPAEVLLGKIREVIQRKQHS